jgi:hypothetical protein
MKLCIYRMSPNWINIVGTQIRKISNLMKLIADFCLIFDKALIKIKTVNILSFFQNKIE